MDFVGPSGSKRTAISIRGGEVQHAGARAAFAFVFHVDGRGDDVRLWAVVLRGEGGDVGVQGLEVTGPGIVDEVVDGLERQRDGDCRLGLWCGGGHFVRV